MKFKFERDNKKPMLQVFGKSGEIAYAKFGISGLQAEIEFPSDWHEEVRAWVRLGFGFGKFCFSFPWYKVVPDEYQCSGPTYGFQFYEDMLWIKYGKNRGKRDDPSTTIYMPWHWKHKKTEILSEPETHEYIYTLESGKVQNRMATISSNRYTWTRWWIPFRRESRMINIEFDDEVGERAGSWKGGVIGCGYEMKRGETPLQTLRRMEAERKFR